MRLLKIKSFRKRKCDNIHVSFLAFCQTKFLIIFVSPFRKSCDHLVSAQSVKQPLLQSSVKYILFLKLKNLIWSTLRYKSVPWLNIMLLMKGLQKTPPSRASCDFRWVKRAGCSHIQGRVGGHSECCWVKNVLHSLSFICGSNEVMFLTRDFQDQIAWVLQPKLFVTLYYLAQ